MDLKQLAKIPVVAQELAAIRKDSRRLEKTIAGPPRIIPPFRNPTKQLTVPQRWQIGPNDTG
jgi:hypothetical protein